jgi:hypothetical protein
VHADRPGDTTLTLEDDLASSSFRFGSHVAAHQQEWFGSMTAEQARRPTAEECCHPLAVVATPSTADRTVDIVPFMTERAERQAVRLAWGIGLFALGLPGRQLGPAGPGLAGDRLAAHDAVGVFPPSAHRRNPRCADRGTATQEPYWLVGAGDRHRRRDQPPHGLRRHQRAAQRRIAADWVAWQVHGSLPVVAVAVPA